MFFSLGGRDPWQGDILTSVADTSVKDVHVTTGHLGQCGVMGHHDDGRAVAVDLGDQFHDTHGHF